MAEAMTWGIDGRVALHLCPGMAYDEEGIYTAATNLISAGERIHIARSRLYISVSCLLSSD
jgi:hypothetical protein